MTSTAPTRRSNAHPMNYWETDLYNLLQQRFPELADRRGDRLSVAKIAIVLDRSAQSVYNMLRSERMSPQNAKALINYAWTINPKAPAIGETDLLPFLLK